MRLPRKTVTYCTIIGISVVCLFAIQNIPNVIAQTSSEEWQWSIGTFGDSEVDIVRDVEFDATGNLVYVGGNGTISGFSDFHLPPEFQSKIWKFSGDGKEKLGEFVFDDGLITAVEVVDDKVFVAGITKKADFPHTDGCYQSLWGGNIDGFIQIYSTDLTQRYYSSYLGANGDDIIRDIKIDGQNIIFIGTTYTPSGENIFPTVGNPISSNTQLKTGFISVINYEIGGPDSMLFSSLVGGTSNDEIISAYLRDGRIFMTGNTTSDDFPLTTESCLSSTCVGGTDMFVSAVNLENYQLSYSTYFGGSFDEVGNSICVDGEGWIYVVGKTTSPDLPMAFKKDVYSNEYHQNGDAVVLKLREDDFACTFLGGEQLDYARYVRLGESDTIEITGASASQNFPVTIDNYGENSGEGGFFTVMKRDLNSIQYSGLIGGDGLDVVGKVLTNPTTSNLILTGSSESSNFPWTSDFPYFDGTALFCAVIDKTPKPSINMVQSVFISKDNDKNFSFTFRDDSFNQSSYLIIINDAVVKNQYDVSVDTKYLFTIPGDLEEGTKVRVEFRDGLGGKVSGELVIYKVETIISIIIAIVAIISQFGLTVKYLHRSWKSTHIRDRLLNVGMSSFFIIGGLMEILVIFDIPYHIFHRYEVGIFENESSLLFLFLTFICSSILFYPLEKYGFKRKYNFMTYVIIGGITIAGLNLLLRKDNLTGSTGTYIFDGLSLGILIAICLNFGLLAYYVFVSAPPLDQFKLRPVYLTIGFPFWTIMNSVGLGSLYRLNSFPGFRILVSLIVVASIVLLNLGFDHPFGSQEEIPFVDLAEELPQISAISKNLSDPDEVEPLKFNLFFEELFDENQQLSNFSILRIKLHLRELELNSTEKTVGTNMKPLIHKARERLSELERNTQVNLLKQEYKEIQRNPIALVMLVIRLQKANMYIPNWLVPVFADSLFKLINFVNLGKISPLSPTLRQPILDLAIKLFTIKQIEFLQKKISIETFSSL